MNPPAAPAMKAVPRLSPSLYEAALACPSRANWMAHGDPTLIPRHPKALLGTCAHRAVQAARQGTLPGSTVDEFTAAARDLFDDAAEELFQTSHPLVRAKFESARRLPFYYLYRERAVLLAAQKAIPASSSGGGGSGGRPRVEQWLESSDQLLAGRPDLIDGREVVDYKTGTSGTPHVLGPHEERQLRLYAYLATENGIDVEAGRIVRANRTEVQLEIPAAEATQEAAKARAALQSLNQSAGSTFDQAATPSADSCRFCDCIPFCSAFWREAEESWNANCGVHIEGEVQEVTRSSNVGADFASFRVTVSSGTAAPGELAIEQIPVDWLTFDGSPVPSVGDTIRIVNARVVGTGSDRVVRGNRVDTSIWVLP